MREPWEFPFGPTVFAITLASVSTLAWHYAFFHPVSAQKAERGTQSWEIPFKERTFTDQAQVWVIDTNGVCLYIFSASNRGGITAVPKTQLPIGAGCQ